MSRSIVLSERYALLDTYMTANTHSIDSAYPSEMLLACAVAYRATDEAAHLAHVNDQWDFLAAYANGDGVIVLPTWSPGLSRDSTARTVVNTVHASRLLRDMGQTTLADTMIGVCDTQAKWLIDHEATYTQSVSSQAPYAGVTEVLFAAILAVTAPYAGTAFTVDVNQNAEIALMFAMLANEPSSDFSTTGDYRTKGLDYTDGHVRMVLAYQDATTGAIPIGTNYLTIYDTVYGRYTLGLVAQLLHEMGSAWAYRAATLTYLTDGMAWLNSTYSTEPTLGGGYYSAHATAAAELYLDEVVSALTDITRTLDGDTCYTDGKFVDPTTRFMLENYTSAGNGTNASFDERSEINALIYTQTAALYGIGAFQPCDLDVRLLSQYDLDVQLLTEYDLDVLLASTRRRSTIIQSGGVHAWR